MPSMMTKILDRIKQGPVTFGQLANLPGWGRKEKPTAIARFVKKLVRNGKIAEPFPQRYVIPPA